MSLTRFNVVKIVGYSIIALGLGLFFLVSILLMVEFTGTSASLGEAFEEIPSPLHRTNYYGKALSEDPYMPFIVQHLHPYYLFSLPWKRDDIRAANNTIVSVDNDGFRVVPFKAESQERAVLLGGSTAFGHFSTSNGTTLASLLSKGTGINVVNRNAPSWNSHQELVALAKFEDGYKFSISLSLANDVSIFCASQSQKMGFLLADIPESFEQLNALVDDIRGESLLPRRRKTWKALLASMFPQTAILYKRIRGDLGRNVIAHGLSRKVEPQYCMGMEQPVVSAFLRNQKAMREISFARGARHWLVIQPHFGLHATANGEHSRMGPSEIAFRKNVIKLVISSKFCEMDCIDLSRIFDLKEGGATHVGNLRGRQYSERIFADEVHLTDAGVEYVAKQLLSRISGLGRESLTRGK